jgi:hypothetical protein
VQKRRNTQKVSKPGAWLAKEYEFFIDGIVDGHDETQRIQRTSQSWDRHQRLKKIKQARSRPDEKPH